MGTSLTASVRPLQSTGVFKFLFDWFDILRQGLTLWTKLASNSLPLQVCTTIPALSLCLGCICACTHVHILVEFSFGCCSSGISHLVFADRGLKLASWAPLPGYNVSGVWLPHLSALGLQAGATTPGFLQWCLGLWPSGPQDDMLSTLQTELSSQPP